MMKLGVGIVEGFYGTPYSEADRAYCAKQLQAMGGKFYIYAPKGDPYLRKRWTESLPTEHAQMLRAFGKTLADHGLEFGVGLSPYELYRAFDVDAQTALTQKLEEIQSLGVTHLALLFDDMRGDLPNLAELQIEIIRFVQKFSGFKSLSFCPTYYSTDTILDRVFGERPVGYLETLSAAIDDSVDFFWTGEKICSTEYSSEHLAEVTRLMKRKPFIWDNYPVNDGQRMCKFLHLREASNRPARLNDEISGQAINPMNQAHLSWIPIRTLFQGYANEQLSWVEAAKAELGDKFARALEADLELFNDQGLEKITDEQKQVLHEKYSQFSHPAAREIIRWLKGEYEVTRELVLTQ
jgi:hyaluronoglucosaminidase